MKSPKELARKIADRWYNNNGLSEQIELALIEYGIQVKEECAKVAEGHYEEHCCEDCPCSYWRENTAKAIRSMEVGR